MGGGQAVRARVVNEHAARAGTKPCPLEVVPLAPVNLNVLWLEPVD